MNSLLKAQEESDVLKKDIESLQAEADDIETRLKVIRGNLGTLEKDLYDKNLRMLHIKEIYRMAKHQFSRLRNESEPHLTEEDVQELEKWVGRAKSDQGLVNIREALIELNKYLSRDIKLNLYALVQKIIIEGAYKQTITRCVSNGYRS
jgi:chromosome segregation ATPase